jgi:hypothetical protein
MRTLNERKTSNEGSVNSETSIQYIKEEHVLDTNALKQLSQAATDV